MKLWLLIYGIFMVNKTSPGTKKLKKVSILFQKRDFQGGPQKMCLPQNKSPRTPMIEVHFDP